MTGGVTRPPPVAPGGGGAGPGPRGERGVDPVVQAGDEDHLRGGQAERHGGEGAGELLIVLEQRGHPAGHSGGSPGRMRGRPKGRRVCDSKRVSPAICPPRRVRTSSPLARHSPLAWSWV